MSHTENSITLVCYDITSNKLRNKIDKCMKNFGVRLQFSMFLCRLDVDGVAHCRENLRKIIAQYSKLREQSDSVIIFERFNPDIADCLIGEKIARESPIFKIV